MDHPKRTLVKTITWRLIAVTVTIIAIYIYSGDIKESLVVGISANAVKMIIYYAHERIWNRSSFGKLKEPEYQI